MRQLSHERLDVYHKATEFLAVAAKILDTMPKGNATLSDQLKRASLSIILNIAEATGRYSRPDNRRHFHIARGSALECGAVLDACRILQLADMNTITHGKELIIDIVSMLSKLSQ